MATLARRRRYGRSINGLIELGVPRQQIEKIHGFKRADGSPDVDAVERRDEWRAPSWPEDSPTKDNAAEIARLAVDALQKISAVEGESIDAEWNWLVDCVGEMFEPESAPIDEEEAQGRLVLRCFEELQPETQQIVLDEIRRYLDETPPRTEPSE